MLITQNHPDFFNALTGANSKIVEQSLICLYEALYGNDFIVDEILDRKKARDIVYSVIQEIPWQRDDEENAFVQIGEELVEDAEEVAEETQTEE